jgi:hypothetical protein
MPPGIRSRLLRGSDQVQFARRSFLRERSAVASDGCFLASTYWRLADDRLSVRRGFSPWGGSRLRRWVRAQPYRCFHSFRAVPNIHNPSYRTSRPELEVEVESHVLRFGSGDQRKRARRQPRLSVPVYTVGRHPEPIRRRLRLALRLETLAPGTSLIPEHEEDR